MIFDIIMVVAAIGIVALASFSIGVRVAINENYTTGVLLLLAGLAFTAMWIKMLVGDAS